MKGGAAAMAHIDRRNRGGTIRYVARYIAPAGRERSESFTRRADAQVYLTEIEAAKLKGTWVDPKHGRTRFRDWHDEWWGSVVNLRPSTRLRDETYLRRYVLPRFGDMPLDAIRQREVRAWVAWLLAQGLAPATVVKAYQLLSKVMTAAVDAGMLAQSPCRGVPLPKVEQEEMRYPTRAESPTWPTRSTRPTGRWSWSAPMAGFASGNWRRCAAPASTSPPAPSTWPRRSTS
jgi:Phage integrase, N-terminal SAM-like domain